MLWLALSLLGAARGGSAPGEWPEGCDKTYYYDLLDNPDQITRFACDAVPRPPNGTLAARNLFNNSIKSSGWNKTKVPAAELLWAVTPDEQGCMAYCSAAHGEAGYTWCREITGPFHVYDRHFCQCRSSRSEGDRVLFECAFNECDTECSAYKGFIISMIIGSVTCVLLFVFGESYAYMRGTGGKLIQPLWPLITPYGLYYVVLWLEIFDWLSDVIFIGIDMDDARMMEGQYMDTAVVAGLYYTAVVMIVVSTIFSLIPFLIAEFHIHYTKGVDEYPTCPWPYSCFLTCVKIPGTNKRIKDTSMKPVLMLRMQLAVFLLLDIPQVAIQIAVSVFVGDVSLIGYFSFVMTALLFTIGPGVTFNAVPEHDRSCTRFCRSKASAAEYRRRHGRPVPPEWEVTAKLNPGDLQGLPEEQRVWLMGQVAAGTMTLDQCVHLAKSGGAGHGRPSVEADPEPAGLPVAPVAWTSATAAVAGPRSPPAEPGAGQLHDPPSFFRLVEPETWCCPACTYTNKSIAPVCATCGGLRETEHKATVRGGTSGWAPIRNALVASSGAPRALTAGERTSTSYVPQAPADPTGRPSRRSLGLPPPAYMLPPSASSGSQQRDPGTISPHEDLGGDRRRSLSFLVEAPEALPPNASLAALIAAAAPSAAAPARGAVTGV